MPTTIVNITRVIKNRYKDGYSYGVTYSTKRTKTFTFDIKLQAMVGRERIIEQYSLKNHSEFPLQLVIPPQYDISIKK